MEKRFGKLSIIKYVALPDSMTHVRKEKKVTLASIHCHMDECKKFVAQFRQANPDVKDIYGLWTYSQEIIIDCFD